MAVRQRVLDHFVLVQLDGRPVLLFLARIVRHVRDGLLDVPHDLLLGARVEDIPALAQQGLQVLGDVPARDVDALDAVGDGEPLVHGHGVRHAVARVEHDARRPARGVEGEHGLYRGVEGGHVERLKEDLRGGVAVAAGVERWFGEEDGVLLSGKGALLAGCVSRETDKFPCSR